MVIRKPPNGKAKMNIRLEAARWRLATLWFCASGALIFLLTVMSLSPAFTGHTQELVGWAMPNFLPTLALMISVLAATALDHAEQDSSFVSRNFFRLSFGLSAFYLLLLFAPLIAPVLIPGGAPTPDRRLEILEQSNIILGPVQGLVVMALGVLFFRKDAKEDASVDLTEDEEAQL